MPLKTGNLRVSIAKVVPNDWNPNEMDPQLYKKLKTGLRRTLNESGALPPIVVRPMHEQKFYQIVDGFHRWKALQELGEEKIAVTSLDISDTNAVLLTNTLNYLRGQPNRSKYGGNIVKLLEHGMTIEQLSSLLPESTEDIDQLLEESEVSMDALQNLYSDDQAEQKNEKPDSHDDVDTWVELKFKCSAAQAGVIEQEITRISERLKGKNARGRALEFMAAQSAASNLE